MKFLIHELSLLNDHVHRYNHKHMAPKDPLATSGLPAINEVLPPREGQASEPKFLILVVDDSADNVAVISLDLQHQGYRVVTASNGEDAVAVATQTLPHLILMDINLPTLDGLGPQGDGLLALHEQVVVASLPRRATLLAAMLKEWQF